MFGKNIEVSLFPKKPSQENVNRYVGIRNGRKRENLKKFL